LLLAPYLALPGLHAGVADSPPPSGGREYFRFLLHKGIFHPLIRTVLNFNVVLSNVWRFHSNTIQR